jgi:hypothetical protein
MVIQIIVGESQINYGSQHGFAAMLADEQILILLFAISSGFC